jgi:hypothetical protein
MLASLQQCWLCLMHLLTRPCAALLLQTLHAACRKDKGQIYTFLNAMLNQYDNEDFDLGIKQFMIEQVGCALLLLVTQGL